MSNTKDCEGWKTKLLQLKHKVTTSSTMKSFSIIIPTISNKYLKPVKKTFGFHQQNLNYFCFCNLLQNSLNNSCKKLSFNQNIFQLQKVWNRSSFGNSLFSVYHCWFCFATGPETAEKGSPGILIKIFTCFSLPKVWTVSKLCSLLKQIHCNLCAVWSCLVGVNLELWTGTCERVNMKITSSWSSEMR